jgi:hypothetical protein
MCNIYAAIFPAAMITATCTEAWWCLQVPPCYTPRHNPKPATTCGLMHAHGFGMFVNPEYLGQTPFELFEQHKEFLPASPFAPML